MFIEYVKYALRLSYESCCIVGLPADTSADISEAAALVMGEPGSRNSGDTYHKPISKSMLNSLYSTTPQQPHCHQRRECGGLFDRETAEMLTSIGIRVNEFKESANGALAFDLILAPACSLSPRNMPSSPLKSRIKTLDQIENKLKNAEEKRKSIEFHYKELWKEKENKTKQMVMNQEEHAKQAKDKLEGKMKSTEENRSAQLKAMQEKLKEHEKHVMDVCQSSENFSKQAKEKLDKKIKNAEENRQHMIASLIDRLKEHELRVEEIRKINEDMRKQMDDKMKAKMEVAITKRQEQLAMIRNKIQEHEKHAEKVRGKAKHENGNVESSDSSISNSFEIIENGNGLATA